MKSNLPHHDIRRSLNSHDCENRILTAARSPTTHGTAFMELTCYIHFTRPVCSSFLLRAHIECRREMVRACVYVVRRACSRCYVFEILFHQRLKIICVTFVCRVHIYRTSCLGHIYLVSTFLCHNYVILTT